MQTFHFKLLLSCFLALFLFSSLCSSAQDVNDVLDKGRVIGSSKYLFLKYQDGKLFYDIRESSPFHWKELSDKIIFLPKEDAVNILILPLNPLNYTFTSKVEFVTDQIDSAAAHALQSITKSIIKFIDSSTNKNGVALKSGACEDLDQIVKTAQQIEQLLNDDQKKQINAAFNSLKSISFEQKDQTEKIIDKIKNTDIDNIEKHFARLDLELENLKKAIEEDNDTASICPNLYLTKFEFSLIYDKLKKTRDAQYVRLSNLNRAFEKVDEVRQMAKTSRTRLDWVIDLDNVPFEEGKNSKETISINQPGIELSKDNEIVRNAEKQLTSTVITFRKFQRFVPEVFAGVAFANINFPQYGTTTDTNGNQLVALAGQDNVRKINFTTMINWNYYTKNSNVNPFMQIGIGANSGYPSLLSGIGLRFHKISGIPAFAFSLGIVSTWVKTLDKLKIGDVVSGTADIQKDIKYEFNWPPKLYIGFQFHL